MGQNFEIKDALMHWDDHREPVVKEDKTVSFFFDRPLVKLQVDSQHFHRCGMNGNFDVETDQRLKRSEELELMSQNHCSLTIQYGIVPPLDGGIRFLGKIAHHLVRIFSDQSAGLFEQFRIDELFLHNPLVELVGQMQHHAEAGLFLLLQQFFSSSLQGFRLT